MKPHLEVVLLPMNNDTKTFVQYDCENILLLFSYNSPMNRSNAVQ